MRCGWPGWRTDPLKTNSAPANRHPIVEHKSILMSKPNPNPQNWTGIALVILVSLTAVSFFYSPGTGDVSIWDNWRREVAAYGLVGGFGHSGTDYPPLAFIILDAVSRCAEAFGTSWFIILKLSLLLFLFATCVCFYLFTRNLILTAALELTLLLNSVALAYLDIFFAPFLIAALFHLQRGNFTRGILLFAISCSIKWQPLIIAPFIFVYVLDTTREGRPRRSDLWKRTLPFIVAAVVIAVPLYAVFGTAIFDSLRRAMTRHTFLSAYGLNLNWLHTWVLHLADPEKYGGLKNGAADYIIIAREPLLALPAKILFYGSYAAILIVFIQRKKTFARLIVYSILGYFAYFVLNTGVHENHLFLVSLLAWILVFIDRAQLVRGINLSIAANANIFLFYGVSGRRLETVIAGLDITVLFAVANVFLFVGFLLHTLKSDYVGLKFWRRPVTAD